MGAVNGRVADGMSPPTVAQMDSIDLMIGYPMVCRVNPMSRGLLELDQTASAA